MESAVKHYTGVFSELGRQLGLVASALRGKGDPDRLPEKARELFIAGIECFKDNPWFTRDEVSRAFKNLSLMLESDRLLSWLENYPELESQPGKGKVAGVVMAGNIPLVGFHDMMCTLACGYSFTGKLSSTDKMLPRAVASMIREIDPETGSRIRLGRKLPGNIDALIATGSDNSARYFEYYYSGTPRIIRGNRNSAAVLDGLETGRELAALGVDVFSHYGLGCRNVSFLLLPIGFDTGVFARHWKVFDHVLQNQKYLSNYKYHKALLRADAREFTDTGNTLLVESGSTASPVSVINYMHYSSAAEAAGFIRRNEQKLQCITGRSDIVKGIGVLPFGSSQQPGPGDYPDGIDTISFLNDTGKSLSLL